MVPDSNINSPVANTAKPLFPKLKPLSIDYKAGEYVKELDGWRFIAVIGVILLHYAPRFFIGAWVVMDLFFVLSGFLITGILLDTKHKKGYYKNFIVRRVIRLFPLYYLCLIIIFFLIPNSFFDLSYYKTHQAWYWLYVSNWLYALHGWSPTKTIDHFWSLAIEEQFYVLWPFFVWLFSRKQLFRFCIFLCIASFILRNIGLQLGFVMPYPYVATIARMEPIAMGAIVAILVRGRGKSWLEVIAPYAVVISFILTLVLFAVAGSFHMENPVHYTITYTVVDVLFAGLLAITLSKNLPAWTRRLFTYPLIRKIAGMTYCLYVFHNPIHSILKYKYLPILQQYAGASVGYLIMFAIGMIITIPLCYAIHRWIEQPLWELKKYF